MAWTIYGTPLRPGYCEVHPDVHEEWPCHICRQEIEDAERERR